MISNDASEIIQRYFIVFHKTFLKTSTPGIKCQYWGFSTSHPNLIHFYHIWESFDNHRKLEFSPEYVNLLETCFPMMVTPAYIVHFELTEGQEELKAALEAPSTQVTITYVACLRGARFLNWTADVAPKHKE